MKIKQVKIKGLYGYLDFNVNFNSNMTFLIGINGSGKTSVLNAITWVLTPSLKKLVDNKFEKIVIKIENQGHIEVIKVYKDLNKDKIIFNRSERSIELPLEVKDNDFRESYFDTNKKALEFINNLPPTPMFLPLDRIRFSKNPLQFVGLEYQEVEL